MRDRELVIRAARESEAAQLAEIRVSAMRPSLEALGRFAVQRARDRFLSTFSARDTQVIERQNEVIGFFVLRAQEQGYVLDHLYVKPEAQGSGVGSEVLRTVADQADAEGKTIRVGALKGSRSNEFYQRHGFRLVEVAEWDNYYVRPAKVEA